MAAAKVRNTYNAAEVASLESTSRLSRSDSGKAGSDKALKRKLDHMNKVFVNAQRARFGQSSEKASYDRAKA